MKYPCDALRPCDTVDLSSLTNDSFVVRPSFIPVDNQLRESSRASSGSKTPPADQFEHGKVSREDLNAAIEAGDWAMVGATAALLADSSGSRSSDSPSTKEEDVAVFSARSVSSSDSDRERELDRMVQKRDWEGVVMAAAQLDASTSLTHPEETDTLDEDTIDSVSRRKKEEIRAEVELLVSLQDFKVPPRDLSS